MATNVVDCLLNFFLYCFRLLQKDSRNFLPTICIVAVSTVITSSTKTVWWIVGGCHPWRRQQVMKMEKYECIESWQTASDVEASLGFVNGKVNITNYTPHRHCDDDTTINIHCRIVDWDLSERSKGNCHIYKYSCLKRVTTSSWRIKPVAVGCISDILPVQHYRKPVAKKKSNRCIKKKHNFFGWNLKSAYSRQWWKEKIIIIVHVAGFIEWNIREVIWRTWHTL